MTTQTKNDVTGKNIRNIIVTESEHSTMRIEGEIPYVVLEKHRTRSIKKLGENIAVDGFRKGHIPEKILVERIGEMAILTEMAERALGDVYPEIITEHHIDAIGRPEISITKIAKNNPLGFTATVAVMPKITLPDYKQIAKEKNIEKESAIVSEKDVEKAIERIQKQKLSYERIQEKTKVKEAAEKDGLTLPTPETAGEETESSNEPVPELTDEYVKTLGAFETIADFKKKTQEHLEKEKEREVTAKNRAVLTDAIVAESIIDLPQVMIDAEIGQMLAQMKEDLKRAHLTMEEYLEHIKKTREELEKEWIPVAEKRAKLQLILNKIAEEEKIEPEKEKVDHEITHLLKHYKDADPARVRIYVESMLRNDKVVGMLEGTD